MRKQQKKNTGFCEKCNKTYLNIPHLVRAMAFLPEQFVLQVDFYHSHIC